MIQQLTSLQKSRWSFRDSVKVLWESLPDHCSLGTEGAVACSKDSVGFFAVLFGYYGHVFQFFYSVMTQISPGDTDIQAFCQKCFPCVADGSKVYAPAFRLTKRKVKRFRKVPLYQCPICYNWLYGHVIDPTVFSDSSVVHRSLFFCPVCHYTRYSSDIITKNNEIIIEQ